MAVRPYTVYKDDERGFVYGLEPIEESIKVTPIENPFNNNANFVKITKGFEVRYLVRDDDYSRSPNEDGDDDLFLVNYHRDFYVEHKSVITEDDVRKWYQGEKIPQTKDYHIFVLSALIHGGVWLSLQPNFSCDPGGWDTSHIGVVMVSKKEVRTKKRAIEVASSLVETWNMFLSGDVYGLVVERYDEDKKQIDHDSVWGYYGYKDALKALETEI